MSNPNSDLWISLEDAVHSTGVSRRTIQEWVRSGQVKREKRKGKVFLWVADLTQITPLTREREPQPDEIPSPEPEVLAPSEIYSGAPLKMLGEKLKENQLMQEQILSKVGEVEGALQRLGELENSPALDERTVKELSLLGSVFRSIHQQNEKVGIALSTQDGMIRELGEKLKTEQGWRERWDQIRSRLTIWKGLTLAAITIFISLSVIGLQEHLRRKGNWGLELLQNKNEQESLINDLDQARLNSTKKDEAIHDAKQDLIKKELVLENMKKERQMLEEKQRQQQDANEKELKELEQKQRTQQDATKTALQHLQSRERELERLRLSHLDEMKKLDERHQEELTRMEDRFDKTLKVFQSANDSTSEKSSLFD